MRCSSKSTAWLASLLATVLGAAAVLVAAQAPADADAVVRQAVEAAVQARMGESAEVRVERLSLVGVTIPVTGEVTAVPEPDGRTGRLARFTIFAGGASASTTGVAQAGATRLGFATAEVRVHAPMVQVTRAVLRGTELAAADLTSVVTDVGAVPFVPLPKSDDAVGLRLSRDLHAGELLTPAFLRSQPLVRSGEVVRTRAQFGLVEVVGKAIAQQSGGRDDRIRLINPTSRRAFTGRVTGAGEVEVIHVQ
jgi:flagella basal body P-ring formation protein FlgA